MLSILSVVVERGSCVECGMSACEKTVLMMSKSNLRLEGWGGVTSRRSERARVLFSFTQNSQEGGGREREGGFRRSKKRGVGRRRTA
jgi:hypothetical protein